MSSNNPYEPPAYSSRENTDPRIHWYFTYVVPVSKMVFWLGVAMTVIGLVITNGSEEVPQWFLAWGTLDAFGFLVPDTKYRIAAFLLVVLCGLNVSFF